MSRLLHLRNEFMRSASADLKSIHKRQTYRIPSMGPQGCHTKHTAETVAGIRWLHEVRGWNAEQIATAYPEVPVSYVRLLFDYTTRTRIEPARPGWFTNDTTPGGARGTRASILGADRDSHDQ